MLKLFLQYSFSIIIPLVLFQCNSKPTENVPQSFVITDAEADSTKADYLIIYNAKCFGSAVEYAKYRHKMNPDIDIGICSYDSYKNRFQDTGTQSNPTRLFLSYAYNHWSKPPKNVFIIGKFDIVDTSKAPDFDSFTGDIDNDDTVEIAIGRLPVDDNNNVFAYLEKVISFEEQFKGRLVIASDDHCQGQNQDVLDFETNARVLSSKYGAGNCDTFFLNKYAGDTCPCVLIDSARKDLFQKLNSQPSLITFLAHYSSQQITDDPLLDSSSIKNLNIPNVYLSNVGTSDFDRSSLALSLLLKKDGGAVGLISTTDCSYLQGLVDQISEFLNTISSDHASVMGDLISKKHFRGHAYNNYTLLGDPLIRVGRI